MTDPIEELCRIAGTSVRRLAPILPHTHADLRRLAYARHAMYVRLQYGGQQDEPAAIARYRRWVKAFYDGD